MNRLVPTLNRAPYRSRQQIEDCARWLSYCVSLGWDKGSLDALEDLWWEYHGDKDATVIEGMKNG